MGTKYYTNAAGTTMSGRPFGDANIETHTYAVNVVTFIRMRGHDTLVLPAFNETRGSFSGMLGGFREKYSSYDPLDGFVSDGYRRVTLPTDDRILTYVFCAQAVTEDETWRYFELSSHDVLASKTLTVPDVLSLPRLEDNEQLATAWRRALQISALIRSGKLAWTLVFRHDQEAQTSWRRNVASALDNHPPDPDESDGANRETGRQPSKSTTTENR